MAKSKITVEQIDERIARWQSKLKRAVNTIDRLQRMRKRAVRKAATPRPEAVEEVATLIQAADAFNNVMKAPVPKPLEPANRKPVEKAAEPSAKPPAPVDNGIPDFLKRSADTPEAAAIRAEQADIKRRKSQGRIAKMKAKASGATKAMPLTGKAALAAIRGDTGAKSA